MSLDPFETFRQPPEEPPFDWQSIIEKDWLAKDIAGYITTGTPLERESLASIVDTLKDYTAKYCGTPEEQQELSQVFPDIPAEMAVNFLYTGDSRMLLTKTAVKTHPEYVTQVIGNNAAMKIAGGSTLEYYKDYQPDLDFRGTDKDLADLGRVAVLSDILFDDDPAAIPVMSKISTTNMDQLALAAITTYAPKGWPSFMTYADSFLLRIGTFSDPTKELAFKQAVASAIHPLYANINFDKGEFSKLAFNNATFEDYRYIVGQQIAANSSWLNPN